ncbi:MAG: helix-turn-helix transcriptional regulator [Campylobacterota bacterium]|nr:helix-turn-helix transcriptional regulator [Campylobacterota bacterium]
MEIFEKINYLLKEKEITKRKFVTELLSLEPKLKSTSEIPTEQTIYRYLSGKREIKIELIPYIAEVLGVTEQELFSFDIEYAGEYNIKYSKEIREIVDLLQYAPKITIENIRNQLLKYKTLHNETKV